MDSTNRLAPRVEGVALSRALGRRQFLRLTAGAGAAAGISALLAACGSGAASPSTSSAGAPASSASAASPAASAASTRASAAASAPAGAKVAAVQLPTFQAPAQMPKPDLPGSTDGVIEPGYINVPKTAFQSVKQTPGDGSSVSIFLNLAGAPPPAVDQNLAWQAWNKAMNVKLNFQFYAFADLAAKFGTLIAGNELPDIVSTLVRQDIPLTPELFDAKAADLTPYLAGDAIKDYPNLAALPRRSWWGVIYNNKIYGVPIPTPEGQFFWWPMIHQELLDAASIAQPKTTDDYKKMMVALTKPQQNQWGSLTQGGYQYSYDMNTGNGWYPSMFGGPNNWAVDSSGKFTNVFETDAYKQALAFDAGLFKAGIFEPDSATLNVITAGQAFIARKGTFVVTGFNPAWWVLPGTAAASLKPTPNVNLLTPPAAPGFKPQYYNGRAAFGIAFLKKAPEARIKMLLRVLDYIAAPFGSEEFLLVNYGAKGQDWNPDPHGNPLLTPTGQKDMAGITPSAVSFLSTLMGRYQVLYSAEDPNYAKRTQGFQKILAPISVEDASLGLYSATQASKGVQVIQKFGDAVTDMVTGRRPLTDLAGLVQDWKTGGGDAIRAEYEKAYAAAH